MNKLSLLYHIKHALDTCRHAEIDDVTIDSDNDSGEIVIDVLTDADSDERQIYGEKMSYVLSAADFGETEAADDAPEKLTFDIQKVWDAEGVVPMPFSDTRPVWEQNPKHLQALAAAGFTAVPEKEDDFEYMSVLYPEVSPRMVGDTPCVVPILGRHFEVSLERSGDRKRWDLEEQYGTGLRMTLTPTDAPLTLERKEQSPTQRNYHFMNWGGQPDFVQGESAFAVGGKALYFLCVLESGWGDSGNVNVFAHIVGGRVRGLYFEASCC